VWARLAELELSRGDLDAALESATKAETLDPDLARTQTVLGFAYLTRIEIDKARAAFDRAIARDPADPLPRLGLGLAKIRDGDVDKGTKEIEIAASLDPNNSLVRSYLGKAYYEQKRGGLAETEFEQAKLLDPKDPTPWFYDAIQKQTTNRPVEALHDLQKAIELNNNRAVYRSKLLLDQDLAARSAAVGRIYQDLNYEQRALVQGWRSVTADPRNYSAHRLLADSYSGLPRHEIARASELLQSQLLQPINITPIQPQLAESNLLVLEGAGPSSPAFQEYNPLFVRDRLAFQGSAIFGSNSTSGDDVEVSGIRGPFSFSLGQFKYETEGFRPNNDLSQDIYTAFVQASLSPATSVQLEFRHRKRERGDLSLNFDETDFSRTFTETTIADIGRAGFRHDLSPSSSIIGSVMYQSLGFEQEEITADGPQETERDRDGFIAEIQHQFFDRRFRIISGVGRIEHDVDQTTLATFPTPFTLKDKPDLTYTGVYSYAQVTPFESLDLLLGINLDELDIETKLTRSAFNPKFGLQYSLFDDTTIRLAAFRTTSRTLTFNQTIEPTQVAGFNQFFNDLDGTRSWRYGAAVDHGFSKTLFGGIEYSERQLEVPELAGGSLNPRKPTQPGAEFFDWDEELGRGYLYWTPHSYVALGAEYLYEHFDRDVQFSEGIIDLDTHSVPLKAGFFHPSGLSFHVEARYVDQSGVFASSDDRIYSGSDNFWTIDASVRYRLPKRYGILTIGASNLFDEEFNYQETDINNPRIIPDRFLFAGLTLNF